MLVEEVEATMNDRLLPTSRRTRELYVHSHIMLSEGSTWRCVPEKSFVDGRGRLPLQKIQKMKAELRERFQECVPHLGQLINKGKSGKDGCSSILVRRPVEVEP